MMISWFIFVDSKQPRKIEFTTNTVSYLKCHGAIETCKNRPESQPSHVCASVCVCMTLLQDLRNTVSYIHSRPRGSAFTLLYTVLIVTYNEVELLESVAQQLSKTLLSQHQVKKHLSSISVQH